MICGISKWFMYIGWFKKGKKKKKKTSHGMLTQKGPTVEVEHHTYPLYPKSNKNWTTQAADPIGLDY